MHFIAGFPFTKRVFGPWAISPTELLSVDVSFFTWFILSKGKAKNPQEFVCTINGLNRVYNSCRAQLHTFTPIVCLLAIFRVIKAQSARMTLWELRTLTFNRSCVVIELLGFTDTSNVLLIPVRSLSQKRWQIWTKIANLSSKSRINTTL